MKIHIECSVVVLRGLACPFQENDLKLRPSQVPCVASSDPVGHGRLLSTALVIVYRSIVDTWSRRLCR